jgi:hypothetical protein
MARFYWARKSPQKLPVVRHAQRRGMAETGRKRPLRPSPSLENLLELSGSTTAPQAEVREDPCTAAAAFLITDPRLTSQVPRRTIESSPGLPSGARQT